MLINIHQYTWESAANKEGNNVENGIGAVSWVTGRGKSGILIFRFGKFGIDICGNEGGEILKGKGKEVVISL
jgi:hypothetical protein